MASCATLPRVVIAALLIGALVWVVVLGMRKARLEHVSTIPVKGSEDREWQLDVRDMTLALKRTATKDKLLERYELRRNDDGQWEMMPTYIPVRLQDRNATESTENIWRPCAPDVSTALEERYRRYNALQA